MAKVNAPSRLSATARRLWKSITEDFELNAGELRILEDICREADLIDRLEAELAEGTFTVRGSQGQPVANPMVAELRQHRATFARLMAALKLPEADDGRATAAGQRSSSARAAANARWATPGGA